ncbi:MAG: energy transducer TonB [Pseudomonadales bacterium]|nr:energy transducer TonB [Pseudomonadales bacterium]
MRYPIAVIASLLVSYALFYFMQSMTLHEEFDSSAVSLTPAQHIEFIRIKRKEVTEVKERRAPKQPELQSVPTHSSSQQQSNQLRVNAPTGIALPPMDIPRFSAAKIPSGVINISLGTVVVNEEAMPVFRIPPIYPQRAAKRGLEGWVELEFSITATGTVRNARVIAASPQGVFDYAALRAISRWKFKPKVMNKVSVERHHVRQRIRFQLEGKK